MRILCDRCKNAWVEFEHMKDWSHIEVRMQGKGILSDLYLCKKCTEDFYRFLNNDNGGYR